MLYLSAQPADLYFLWQLEIQLKNFEELGIEANNIHVLLSYDKEGEIPTIFNHLIAQNQACFFFYKDDRTDHSYASSLRPHILAKHFKIHPYLSERVIFYHDSDILIRQRFDEKFLMDTDFWYMSDTRNYISAWHLKKYGEGFFVGMCELMEVDPKMITENDFCAGGAQTVLKGVDANFWLSVEKYGTKLFNYIYAYKASHTLKDARSLQPWCADMWALLWLAWKMGYKTKINKELDFCWPMEHISKWYSTKILHNSGFQESDKDTLFMKMNYRFSTPYYVDFAYVDKEKCSIIYKNKIDELANNQQSHPLPNLTVIIHLRNFSETSFDRINTYVRYLKKHLNVAIVLVESGDMPRLKVDVLREFCTHYFIGFEDLGKFIAERITTPLIFVVKSEIFIAYNLLIESYNLLAIYPNNLIIPYSVLTAYRPESFVEFKNYLSFDLLKQKEIENPKELALEAFMQSLASYINCGGENLSWNYFTKPGFNLERASRCEILGIEVVHLEGLGLVDERLFFDHVTYTNKAEKRYLQRISGSTRNNLVAELSILNYSHKRIADSVLTDDVQINWPVQVNYINISPEKNTTKAFDGYPEFKLLVHQGELDMGYSKCFWKLLVKAIEKHDFNKQPYFLMSTGDIYLTKDYNKDYLIDMIKSLLLYKLDYINTGTVGGFIESKVLKENLIWVNNCYSLNFVIFSKSLCEKISKLAYSGDNSVDLTISKLSNLKAIAAPFFVKQKTYGLMDKTNHVKDVLVDHQVLYDDAEKKLEYLIAKGL
ncbi:hypothetical protein J5U18_08370 [Sphingobacteriaceae bacterium WQ 2009]|uniref:Uncharacterized protein n=1 Tax=Rhinopithecimicrobium faecis TaxID=2820698 RepID=A0A8T4H9X0_9SPHI|nr:hypothetical protein [Sphingobacteriaceae bacterium WQ 2009]